jgi:hypothetical protein
MPPSSNRLIEFSLAVVGDSSDEYLSFLNTANFKRSEGSRRAASKQLQEKNGKCKSVHFDEYDETVEISHKNDFSDEKRNRIWFSSQEQAVIRESCFYIILQSDAGEEMDPDDLLGLEKQTQAGSDKLDVHLQDASDAVFKLQNIQKLGGVSHPDQIAKFYQKSTVQSVEEAHAWAVKLAADLRLGASCRF